jgi:hypothetical protein
MNREICLVVCSLLGMLIYHILKGVCGCDKVVEGWNIDSILQSSVGRWSKNPPKVFDEIQKGASSVAAKAKEVKEAAAEKAKEVAAATAKEVKKEAAAAAAKAKESATATAAKATTVYKKSYVPWAEKVGRTVEAKASSAGRTVEAKASSVGQGVAFGVGSVVGALPFRDHAGLGGDCGQWSNCIPGFECNDGECHETSDKNYEKRILADYKKCDDNCTGKVLGQMACFGGGASICKNCEIGRIIKSNHWGGDTRMAGHYGFSGGGSVFGHENIIGDDQCWSLTSLGCSRWSQPPPAAAAAGCAAIDN